MVLWWHSVTFLGRFWCYSLPQTNMRPSKFPVMPPVQLVFLSLSIFYDCQRLFQCFRVYLFGGMSWEMVHLWYILLILCQLRVFYNVILSHLARGDPPIFLQFWRFLVFVAERLSCLPGEVPMFPAIVNWWFLYGNDPLVTFHDILGVGYRPFSLQPLTMQQCTSVIINQLPSRRCKIIKSTSRLLAGSNHRPLVYKTSALATELKSRCHSNVVYKF